MFSLNLSEQGFKHVTFEKKNKHVNIFGFLMAILAPKKKKVFEMDLRQTSKSWSCDTLVRGQKFMEGQPQPEKGSQPPPVQVGISYPGNYPFSTQESCQKKNPSKHINNFRLSNSHLFPNLRIFFCNCLFP